MEDQNLVVSSFSFTEYLVISIAVFTVGTSSVRASNPTPDVGGTVVVLSFTGARCVPVSSPRPRTAGELIQCHYFSVVAVYDSPTGQCTEEDNFKAPLEGMASPIQVLEAGSHTIPVSQVASHVRILRK